MADAARADVAGLLNLKIRLSFFFFCCRLPSSSSSLPSATSLLDGDFCLGCNGVRERAVASLSVESPSVMKLWVVLLMLPKMRGAVDDGVVVGAAAGVKPCGGSVADGCLFVGCYG